MRIVKWIFLIALAVTGVFLLNVVSNLTYENYNGLPFDRKLLLFLIVGTLVASIPILPYVIIIYKKLRDKNYKRNRYILFNLVGFLVLTYIFSFAKLFSHGALWEDGVHYHSLVQILI